VKDNIQTVNKKGPGAPLGSKNALGNKGGKGRETAYKNSFAKVVEKMCHLGLSDKELADFFEVSKQTLYTWKGKHPAFAEAIKRGKQVSDAEVANKLYKRAIGYSHKEDKIFIHRGKPVVVSTLKHYPPDTAAIKFWLTNKQKDIWKDRQDHGIDFNSMTDEQLDNIISKITSNARK
jgi:hypothetical protein